MLSKNKISLLNSLHLKKHRIEHQVFVAEGSKLVLDLLDSEFEVETVIALPEWFRLHHWRGLCKERIEASEQEMKKITLFSSPSEVMAIVKIPVQPEFQLNKKRLYLALDGIQNPGNMGTIVRLADWFGIKQIICSSQCTDIFNPKTVQASMGAISRVEVYYQDLVQLLQQADSFEMPIYGSFLDGENIYDTSLSTNGILILGNEGNGISKELESLCTKKINIPNFPIGTPTSESLNVSIAASIICSEFRRRVF